MRYTKKLRAEVVVIGGGASGMICAAAAAKRGRDVVLIEPNRDLGRKLRLTGKGRCNVTNNCGVKDVIANIPGDGRFLYSALSAFPPAKVMEFFESMGVPLKTERGMRVFPVSDSSHDVANALHRCLLEENVRILRTRAERILRNDAGVCGVAVTGGSIECESAAVCTGGISYPGTGSTGDGCRFAAQLGHSIVPLRPSLVPLVSPDGFCAEMQGISLKNVGLKAFEDDRCVFTGLGEMLFTHFGVSGPLVLSASAHMRDFKAHKYRLSIDLKCGLDEKKLDARILRDFGKYSNREMRNALEDLEVRAMIPAILELSGIPGDAKANSVTREQRRSLVRVFKNFPVGISGTRPAEEAIITAGGVCTKEVDPRTMASKIVPGLYFAGEVLDVDAYTGGFNLQIAWSTGYAAGSSV